MPVRISSAERLTGDAEGGAAAGATVDTSATHGNAAADHRQAVGGGDEASLADADRRQRSLHKDVADASAIAAPVGEEQTDQGEQRHGASRNYFGIRFIQMNYCGLLL